MKKRDIYISPSVQEHNLYYDKKHTEEDVMNLIADVVVAELKKTAAFNIFRNKKTFTLAEIIADSNKYLNAGEGDLHIALHSNAGGGRGCTAFSFAENAQSDYFAHSIYNQIEP
jgi:N-acetylmuramoyl-L-alanine amidase